MTERIILIDSNNIAYRAFYALPDTIMTSSGIMTNAVLGFTNMFLKIVEDYRPDIVICAFDSKSPTFRHEMFEEYKVHRKKMPEELGHQLPLIREVMEAFNVSCIQQEGVEADDILASIAKKATGRGDETVIVTGDKDMLQMVSDKVKVLSSKKSITDTIIYDAEGVSKKMGIGPGKVKDLLALMGDSSDNIPGIPGIGPKTATRLINEFGSLESIYENIDSIKSEKLQKLLRGNEALARISKKLTTLKDDIEIDDRVLERSFKNIDYNRVKGVFENFEFSSLIKRLPRYAGLMDIRKEELSKGEGIELKIELEKYSGGINFAGGEDKIYLIPWGKDGDKQGIILYPGKEKAFLAGRSILKEKDKAESLKDIMENPKIGKTGIRLKQVIKFFKKAGISVEGELNDLEIMYLVLNPLKSEAHIADMSIELLNINRDDIALCGSSKEKESGQSTADTQMSLNFEEDKRHADEYDKDGIEKYEAALKDLSLFRDMEKKLAALIGENELGRLYREIEEPLIKVLAEIEHTGVAIDTGYLNGLIREYDSGIKKLTDDIYGLCGMEFNINSSQQLAEVLYEKLDLPALKKTKTGFSTDAVTLKAIRHTSPVIDKILDYREKSKLKNTYVDVLPGLIDPEDERVHTTYNQMGTTTGRISSNDPNLQNIPVRTSYGRQIRKAFIPGKGYDLLMASDYSQIELRILAHLSGDKNLIDTFNRDEDIHNRTASEIFEIDYESVPRDLRRKAKAINFGIIYGMTDFGLASRLSIPVEEAKDYIKKYFDRYPMVDKYLKSLIEDAAGKGYSTTMFGRKRYIRELGSSNARIRSLGERYAVNTPIQGSAADIMKLATIKIYDELKSNGIDSNIILHVHDEIVLELKKADIDRVRKVIKESMEDILELKVKLKVDIKTGKNWYI